MTSYPVVTVSISLGPSRTPLVGRDAELSLLGTIFADGKRLVSIVGPPGVGKTRLASEYAASLREPDRPAGGVFVCDLGEARGVADLSAIVGAAVGAAPAARGRPRLEIGPLLGRRGPLLVVLDNLERVATEAAPVFARWAEEAPQARLLVTSRIRLGIEERCLELGPLARAGAVALFVELARRIRVGLDAGGDDPAVLDALVDRLDRLPLAIELAAARVAVLSPAQLLERLAHGLDSLRGGRHGRHSSLVEAIACSWELLPAHGRAALAQCSVFCGGFSVEAAEAVVALGAEAPPVLDVLQALRDASLLGAGEIGAARERRFALLAGVRAFADRELLAAGERDAAQARHGAYYVAEGQRLARACEGPQGVEALRRLALERENLLAVHRRDQARAPACAAHALLALHPLMRLRGPGTDDAPLLEACVAAARRGRDEALLAAALIAQGEAAYRHGHAALAQAALEEALERARRAGLASLEGRARLGAGRVEYGRGNVDDAARECAEAASIHHRLGELYHEGVARNILGCIEETRGHLEDAAARFEEALDLFRRCGNAREQGICLLNLGVVRHSEGRPEDARMLLEQALEWHRLAGDRASEADNLVNLASVHLAAGRLDDAERALRVAVVQERELGNRRFEGIALGNLAIIAHELGELEEARARYQEALDLLAESGDLRQHPIFLPFFAAAEASLGLRDEARRDFALARERLAEIGDPGNLLMASVLEGVLDAAAGDLAAARSRLAEGEAARRGRDVVRDSELPVALRLLRAALGAGVALELAPDARRFRVPGAAVVDLSRRGSLRLVLVALAEQRRAAPGVGLPPAALFAAGWPGQKAAPASADARVYTAVRTLRRLGLERILVRQDDGYLLDAAVSLRELPLEEARPAARGDDGAGRGEGQADGRPGDGALGEDDGRGRVGDVDGEDRGRGAQVRPPVLRRH